MSTIKISCTNCQQTLDCKEEWAGMNIACPYCGHEFAFSLQEEELPPELPDDMPPELPGDDTPPDLPAGMPEIPDDDDDDDDDDEYAEDNVLVDTTSCNILKSIIFKLLDAVGVDEEWLEVALGIADSAINKNSSVQCTRKRRMIRTYFFPPALFPVYVKLFLKSLTPLLIWFVPICVITIILNINGASWRLIKACEILTGICFIIGIVKTIKKFIHKKAMFLSSIDFYVPDAKIDRFIAKDTAKAHKLSLDKANINENMLIAKSQMLVAPCVDEAACGNGAKVGEDGELRYTPISVTMVHMLEHQLVCYSAALDLLTGNYLNETIDEFFYEDIVSVQTLSESEKVGKQKTSAEYFVLTTRGGTSFRMAIERDEWLKSKGDKKDRSHASYKIINAVRKMIREKKTN